MDAKYGPFDIIKLDVEGFEGRVIAGCERMLTRRCRLAIELHLALLGQYGTTVDEIFDMIGVDDYDGKITWGECKELVPFDRMALPEAPGVLIYLWPKNEIK